MGKKHGVLGDHHRVGKRFIPPFLHRLSGRFTDVEWVDRLAPEVLWIALLHDAYGLGVGAELALSAAQSLRSIKPKALGVRASDYGNLNDDEGRQWASNLDEDRCEQIRTALRSLVTMYPTFPMSSLLGAVDDDSPDDQQQLGRVLQPLLDPKQAPTAATRPGSRATPRARPVEHSGWLGRGRFLRWDSCSSP